MIAANTGFLFKDRPFIERIAAAAAAGFDAVEFHDEAQRENLDDVRGFSMTPGYRCWVSMRAWAIRPAVPVYRAWSDKPARTSRTPSRPRTH